MPQLPFKWPPIAQIIAQIFVVLCIIGVMVAILFPVFQKPHTYNSRHCPSNMKILGTAFVQYEQGFDEKFPSGNNSIGNGWAGQTNAYLKSPTRYQCPEDPQDGKFISYAENLNLVRQNLESLTKPAATVELYEFSTLNCDPSRPETVSATGLSAPQDSTRHDLTTFGLNFLMVDGHVRWLLPAQVSGGVNAVRPKSLPSGKIVRTFAVK